MDQSATEKEAKEKAIILCDRLGKGWKISIHENKLWSPRSWFYSATSPDGLISVRCNRDGKYGCMMSNNYPGTGSPGWYSGKNYKTPRYAVLASMRTWRKQLRAHQAVLDTAELLYYGNDESPGKE